MTPKERYSSLIHIKKVPEMLDLDIETVRQRIIDSYQLTNQAAFKAISTLANELKIPNHARRNIMQVRNFICEMLSILRRRQAILDKNIQIGMSVRYEGLVYTVERINENFTVKLTDRCGAISPHNLK